MWSLSSNLRDRMLRGLLIWIGFASALLAPVVLAAFSPLLAWRDGVYIAAGFAGIIALAALLAQPLLAAGWLPGVRGRLAHRWVGAVIVGLVLVHIGGLWITSPPDVIDVLVFRSPTPFGVWGAIAMWAVFGTAVLSFFRHRIRMRLWRGLHGALALLILLSTGLHAVLIEGAMEPMSKALLCLAALGITGFVVYRRRMVRAWLPRAD